LGRVDVRQGLDLPDGTPHPCRISEEPRVSKLVFVGLGRAAHTQISPVCGSAYERPC
jgi:hypothetical protein